MYIYACSFFNIVAATILEPICCNSFLGAMED